MLDCSGFVDFATVVHEHVIGLRSWHERAAPASARQPNLLNARATNTSTVDNKRSAAPLSLAGLHGNEGQQGSKVDGQRSAHQGATSPGGNVREKREIGIASATKQPFADTSFEVKTKLYSPLKGNLSSLRKLDVATPWLGWDLAAPNDTITGEIEGCSSTAAVASTFPTVGGETAQSREDVKAEPKEDGDHDHEGDQKGHKGKENTAEEPKMNRTYGGADNDNHGASVNKLFAFQTDRVVRMLDDMF